MIISIDFSKNLDYNLLITILLLELYNFLLIII